MSRIKSRNTTPEIAVRQIVHRLGYRFRLKPQKLPGSPDIVLTKLRTAIFVHGCFWHHHKNCRLAYLPKSNRAFWKKKFAANLDRDRRAMRNLRQSGWRTLVIWECQVSAPARLSRRTADFLHKHASPPSYANLTIK